MIKNTTEKINDFYEYEIETQVEETAFSKKAIIELRLYEKRGGEGEESIPETRELINTYSKEIKKTLKVASLLGTPWEMEILLIEQRLKTKAVRRAIELWSNKILPIQIKQLLGDTRSE